MPWNEILDSSLQDPWLAHLSFFPVTPLNRREMTDYRARICFPEWETKCCEVQNI
jgi:hypothetical protein